MIVTIRRRLGQNFYSLALLLSLILTVIVYWPGLSGPLLLDDFPNLVENPLLVIDGTGFDGWRTAALSNSAGIFRRPIAMLTFAANFAVEGVFNPFTLKLVNLSIHLVMGVLVYVLGLEVIRALRLSGYFLEIDARVAAGVATLIWLLHPLHISTVLYSVQRMAQLSALFVTLGLYVYLRYRNRWALESVSRAEVVAVIIWLMLLTLAATLSKENGLLMPWLLLVAEVTLFFGLWNGKRVMRLDALALTLLVSPVVALLIYYLIEPTFFTSGYLGRDFDLGQRLMTQARILWHYIGWLVVPDIRGMGIFHDDIQISTGLLSPVATLVAILAWVVLLVCCFFFRRRLPIMCFGLLFFLAAHSMESSFISLEMVFEHRNYLPSVGVCIAVAVSLLSVLIRLPRLYRRIPMVALIAALTVATSLRAVAWSDQLVLARKGAIYHPDSIRANVFYAITLLSRVSSGVASQMEADMRLEIESIARRHLLIAQKLARSELMPASLLLIMEAKQGGDLKHQDYWFSVLEEALEQRLIQPDDIISLQLVVRCITLDKCDVDAYRFRSLLDSAVLRNPDNMELQLLKYQYLRQSGVRSNDSAMILDELRAKAPESTKLSHLNLIVAIESADEGLMYAAAKKWLVYDKRRKDLPLLLSYFR